MSIFVVCVFLQGEIASLFSEEKGSVLLGG